MMRKREEKRRKFKAILSFCLIFFCFCFAIFYGFIANKASKISPEEILPTINSPISNNVQTVNSSYVSQTGANGADLSLKGGAISIENSTTVEISGGQINGHYNTYGGAIFVPSGAVVKMTGGIISNNNASYGGAIYIQSGGKMFITGGIVKNNTASVLGNDIYVEAGGTLEVSGTADVGDVYDEYEQSLVVNFYVDGTKKKSEHVLTCLNDIEMPISSNECCGWFFDENMILTVDYGSDFKTQAQEKSKISDNQCNVYTKQSTQEMRDQLTFEATSDGANYLVSAKSKNVIGGEIVIPETYNDVAVSMSYGTGVSDTNNPFQNCLALQKIYMPKGITRIGACAFANYTNGANTYSNYAFESVNIHDKISQIGALAFHGCMNLKNLILSTTNFTCTSDALGYVLDSINFLGNIEEWCQVDWHIGFYAKSLKLNGESQTNVTIPETITEIKPRTFYSNTNIFKVQLHDNIISIGYGAFENSSIIRGRVVLPKELTIIDNNAFAGTAVSEIVFNNKLTQIGEGAFYGCNLQRSILIPQSMKTIGSRAFGNCPGIKTLFLPSSVEMMDMPFDGCASTMVIYTDVASESAVPQNWGSYWNEYEANKKLTVQYNASRYEFEKIIAQQDGFIFTGSTLTGYSGTKSNVIIPDIITDIETGVFKNNSNIYSIEFPSSIASIPAELCSNCKNLEKVTFKGNVQNIGQKAFASCNNLREIVGLENVQNLQTQAFFNCVKLESIGSLSSLETMGDECFANCSTLIIVHIPASVTSIGQGVFASCKMINSVEVESANSNFEMLGNCIVEKSTKTIVCGFNNSTIHNSIKAIGNASFAGSTLTQITIPENVKSIGANAFAGSVSLSQVEILGSLESIGDSAFANCKALKNFTIPLSLTSIGKCAFANSGLTKIVIPGAVKKIEVGAFYNCQKLAYAVVSEGVQTIGTSAFGNNAETFNVFISSSVQNIENLDSLETSEMTANFDWTGVTIYTDATTLPSYTEVVDENWQTVSSSSGWWISDLATVKMGQKLEDFMNMVQTSA